MVNDMKEMISAIQQNCMEALMVSPDPFLAESKGGFKMILVK